MTATGSATNHGIDDRALRVVLDARPLQAPTRNPTTAAYLDRLLQAFAGHDVDGGGSRSLADGDSFLFLLDTPGPDPSARYPGLPFAGRRRLPRTRRLRAATLTLDPFLLRAVSIGTTFGAARGSGDVRGVLHVTGGTLPIASGLPMVVTLLDLAAWELPSVYQRGVAERFGQRLRVRLLRQAERLIVASEATARAASGFLRFPRDRVHVVPLAPTLRVVAGETPDAMDRFAALRERLGVPERYLLYRAQYDARKDVPTLLRAIARSRVNASPARGLGTDAPPPAPPDVLMIVPRVDAGEEDREHASDAEALDRLVRSHGIEDRVRVLPLLSPDEEAAVLSGARALLHPVLVEGSGLPLLDALAAGVPVVATNVGAVAELVGKAGILVPPRDADRLAAGLATIWSNDRVHGRLARAAAASPAGRRTWSDVARETRAVYALAARRAPA